MITRRRGSRPLRVFLAANASLGLVASVFRPALCIVIGMAMNNLAGGTLLTRCMLVYLRFLPLFCIAALMFLLRTGPASSLQLLVCAGFSTVLPSF